MVEEPPSYLNSLIDKWDLMPEGWQAALVVFLLVLGTATVALVVSRVVWRLEQRCMRTSSLWDDAFLHALRKPAIGFVWLQGVYWAAEVAHRYSQAEIFSANDRVLEIGFVVLLVWTLLGVIKQGEYILASPVKMEQPLDYTTVTAISKLMRAVVIITAVLILMQSLGYSMSGVLAFGGVGGIAIGFAAKDLLANFFGGFIVHLDRPFKVGDWVRSPDRNIEGTVEHIGWRVTTIRTFDMRPLYVPNSVFTTIAVENPSRMSNRRIFETVGLRYADVGKMADVVADIRTMLETHEDIDTSKTLIVNFLQFGDSTLDIMVYTFTRTTVWVEYHAIKQDVLLRISDIIVGYGAEVAFPTRTLHVADALRLEREETDDARQGSAGEPRQQAAECKPRIGGKRRTRQGDEGEQLNQEDGDEES